MPTAPSDAALNDAALLGAAAGLRAFTPAAALALQGCFGAGRARQLLPLLAVGELAGDKLPMTPPRTFPPGLAARALSGAACGNARGGVQAAVVGAAVAVVAAYGGQHTRQWLVRRSGRPDAQIAVAEDALAVLASVLGARAAAR
jgi:uncharacterized membrane protein